jgi:predicted DNA-binding transcriptional regulator YafY
MPTTAKQPQTRPPIRRMLSIHEKLKSGKHPTCRSLCEEFGIRSKRTILRDVAFMKDQLLLPIEYDSRKHGYYYTRPVDQFPGLAVSEAELFALLIAQKAVIHYKGTRFHNPLRTAFETLTSDLDPKVLVHITHLGEAMDIRIAGSEEQDEESFQIATRAVQQHRPLKFQYRKHATKGVEHRHIHPYQLVCANNRWYVLGHDLKRKAIRAFVLARIKDPEILPGTFEHPKDFKVQDYLKGSFGIFKGGDDLEVVIDLDLWASDVMRGRRWHASQQVTELPGGEIRVAFRLDNLEEIEPWVLSWGSHATVVRPRALVDRVLNAATELQARYGTTPKPSGTDRQTNLRLKIDDDGL